MNETEWLACTETRPMLLFLRDRASARKWRLFAVACCRRAWHLLADERSRRAIEVAERYADGRASEEELDAACFDATHVPESAIARAAGMAAFSGPNVWELDHVAQSAPYAVEAACQANPRRRRAAGAAEDQAQADLLRDLFGNPFHSVVVEPAWLTRAVVTLAQVADEERSLPAGALDPERLAVLADALEDAGCTDGDILGHLRGPGPHVRGCWAVDLLLGR